MKARTLGFVAVFGLLALCAKADDAPAVVPPAQTDIALEVLRGFTYPLSTPTRIAVPVIAAQAPAAGPDSDDGSVIHLATLQVNGKPDQTYRGVNDAWAEAQLSVPCDLIVKNGAKFQFRALGPPLRPLNIETPSEQLRALFPVITLGW